MVTSDLNIDKKLGNIYLPKADWVNEFPEEGVVDRQNAVDCASVTSELGHCSVSHLILGLTRQHEGQQNMVSLNLTNAIITHVTRA
jgi:hypothetical protein